MLPRHIDAAEDQHALTLADAPEPDFDTLFADIASDNSNREVESLVRDFVSAFQKP